MPSILPAFDPFDKPKVSDFRGVLIPLHQAIRHRSLSRMPRNPSRVADLEMSELSSAQSESEAVNPDDTFTMEKLKAEVEHELALGIPGHDTVYDRKAMVINKAMQDIGMGKYQWQAFVLAGFGWFADQLWLQGIASTLHGLEQEFDKSETSVRYATLSLFLGLSIGASFWGIASDLIGRRLAFNFTLFIAGAFGIAAGFGPSFLGTCALYACVGLGVGGNLPVDGALFLEFLPMASGSVLTLLSVWWPVGQLAASLIAWGFMVNYSDDWGWRYTIITCGGLTFTMFVCRFFLFQFFETPKFLLSRGRQAEAVGVIHGIAYINRTKTWLTEEILNEIGGDPVIGSGDVLSIWAIIKRGVDKFGVDRIWPLFYRKTMGVTTALLWFIWTAIGMAYPLFNAFLLQYLGEANGKDIPPKTSYRNYAILSVVGVPGSIIACFVVNIRFLGRKRTMAVATLLSGIFLILFTRGTTPGYQLAMGSLEAFFQNITYGVLFAYTPEVFPAPSRGTGTGIASFLNRMAGLSAPLVAINVGLVDREAPIYASAGLFIAASIAMLLLPIETLGRQSM